MTTTISHAYQLTTESEGAWSVCIFVFFFCCWPLRKTEDGAHLWFQNELTARASDRFFITTYTHLCMHIICYILLFCFGLVCFAFISIHFNSCPIEMCTLAIVDFAPSYRPASYSHNLFHIEWSISEGKSNANRKISNKFFNQQQYVLYTRFDISWNVEWRCNLIFFSLSFLSDPSHFNLNLLQMIKVQPIFQWFDATKYIDHEWDIFVLSSEIHSDDIFCSEIMRILPDAIFASIIQLPLNLTIHVKPIFFSADYNIYTIRFFGIAIQWRRLKKSTLFKYKYEGSSKLCRSYRSKWRFCLMIFFIDLIIYCPMCSGKQRN